MSSANVTAGVRVGVEIDWDALEPGVAVDLVEAGAGAPVGSEDYERWVRGAIYGVRFAITETNSMPCVVRLVELAVGEGTTATQVAAAAALAVWEAIGVELEGGVLARIHRRVVESRQQGADWLGDFATAP